MAKDKFWTNVPTGKLVDQIVALAKAQGGTAQIIQEDARQFTVITTLPGNEAPPEMPADDTVPAGWVKIAEAEKGVKEAGPGGSNPRIEAYHASTTSGAAADSVPWCSSFVNYCITKAGLKGTGSKLARSWATWGESTEFRPGCVVVLERGSPPKGHVGFFVGKDGSTIRLLGGNQSDAVGIAGYEAKRVIAIRWPLNAALAEPDGREAALAGVTAARLPAPSQKFDLDSLNTEYQQYFAACTVNVEQQGSADAACKSIENGRTRYEKVGAKVGVPWHIVGLLHHMECACDFAKHLHNGDPLTARTMRVPQGRPKAPPAKGGAQYEWEESAVDALADLGKNAVWSRERLLFHAEQYNGWGYRTRTLPSTYLWSGSNLYVKGKFVADHQFNSEAVSKQLGVGTLLRQLIDRGTVPA